MMKILLVNPPFHRLKGLTLSYYPLGLGYLGSSLKQAGFEVKLYQAENPREKLARPLLKNKNQLMFHTYKNYQDSLNNTGHPVWHEIAAVMALEKPDLVGVSCMTPTSLRPCRLLVSPKRLTPHAGWCLEDSIPP